MTKISLAKALKLKNRMTGDLKTLETRVQSYNSNEKGRTVPYDGKSTYLESNALRMGIVHLKTTIQLANKPIEQEIIFLGELKAEISFLSSVPTRKGVEITVNYGKEITTEFIASISKEEIDAVIKELQSKIDDLQDKIDAHNATTMIEFPSI